MKIIIDPQAFCFQDFGGVTRYHTELIVNQKEYNEFQLPIIHSENLHLKKHKFNNFNFKYFILKRFLSQFEYRKALELKSFGNTINILNNQDYDLFVTSFYNTYFFNYLKGKPYVLTIHDMIHELFPDLYSYDKDTVSNKKVLIENANAIIVVSDNTKKDILYFYPHVDENKIFVIPLATSINTSPKCIKANILKGKKYILFVGSREGYKNFLWMISAISKWLIKNDLYLVCLGGGDFNNTEIYDFKIYNITNRVFHFVSSEEELSSFYSNAELFLFPSLYEGFGLPILESMSCGCPVVLPFLSSFPEVASNAGVFYDFDSPNDLLDKLDTLHSNLNFRLKIKEQGFLNVKKYSWKNTSIKCQSVYESVL
jgi:glycosyltransferase involved in cell wall biosynthesis